MSQDRAASGLVITGCSARKAVAPAAALDLYEGWCVPLLRRWIDGRPELRERVVVLSARHGLLHANQTIAPYDQRMTPERAACLRPVCASQLDRALTADPVDQAVVLLEPGYVEALPPLAERFRVVHYFSRPVEDWAQVTGLLAGWGWAR
jgi:hypothetical protein